MVCNAKLIWNFVVFAALILTHSVNKALTSVITSCVLFHILNGVKIPSPSESDTQIFLRKAVTVYMIDRATCSKQPITEY